MDLDHNDLFILRRFADGWHVTGRSWRRGAVIEQVLVHDMRRIESLAVKGAVALTSDPGCTASYEITEAGEAAAR